jgi:hypothetical protein
MFGYFIGTKTNPSHRQLKPASIPRILESVLSRRNNTTVFNQAAYFEALAKTTLTDALHFLDTPRMAAAEENIL